MRPVPRKADIREALHLLRPTLLLVFALVLAGTLAITLAHLWRQEWAEERDQARLFRNTMQSRLARFESDANSSHADTVLLESLLKRRIIGEAARQEWLDEIRHLREEKRLFEIHWELETGHPLEAVVAPGRGSGYEFVAYRLHIKMPLLHEEDLLRFLEDLRSRLSAFVRPRHCTMDILSQPDNPASGSIPPRLQAECEIDLITLHPGDSP